MFNHFDLRAFIYDRISCNEVIEYFIEDKLEKMYKVHNIYDFDYEKFHKYFDITPMKIIENLKPHLIGKQQYDKLNIVYISGFFKAIEILIYESELNKISSADKRTFNLDKLMINVNQSFNKKIRLLNEGTYVNEDHGMNKTKTEDLFKNHSLMQASDGEKPDTKSTML